MPDIDEKRIHSFRTAAEFNRWLEEHHAEGSARNEQIPVEASGGFVPLGHGKESTSRVSDRGQR